MSDGPPQVGTCSRSLRYLQPGVEGTRPSSKRARSSHTRRAHGTGDCSKRYTPVRQGDCIPSSLLPSKRLHTPLQPGPRFPPAGPWFPARLTSCGCCGPTSTLPYYRQPATGLVLTRRASRGPPCRRSSSARSCSPCSLQGKARAGKVLAWLFFFFFLCCYDRSDHFLWLFGLRAVGTRTCTLAGATQGTYSKYSTCLHVHYIHPSSAEITEQSGKWTLSLDPRSMGWMLPLRLSGFDKNSIAPSCALLFLPPFPISSSLITRQCCPPSYLGPFSLYLPSPHLLYLDITTTLPLLKRNKHLPPDIVSSKASLRRLVSRLIAPAAAIRAYKSRRHLRLACSRPC